MKRRAPQLTWGTAFPGLSCWWLPVPADARSYSADEYTGVADSIAALVTVSRCNENVNLAPGSSCDSQASGGIPFDGVVGHSQGGMLAALLLARCAITDKTSAAESAHPVDAETAGFPTVEGIVSPSTWAVIVGAAWPRPHGTLLTAGTGRCSAPSLHVIGDSDTIAPSEMAERVRGCLGGELLRHPGGHEVPTGLPQMAEWVACRVARVSDVGGGSRGKIQALQALPEPQRTKIIAELAAAHSTQFGGRTEAVRTQAYSGESADSGELPTTIVAVDEDGTTVGSIAVVVDDMGGRRPDLTPWIATLWVSPSHRRQGWATRLLKAAIQLAASAAPKGHIYLWTHTQALEDKLYGPAGFHVIERLDHRDAPAAIMAADVTS